MSERGALARRVTLVAWVALLGAGCTRYDVRRADAPARLRAVHSVLVVVARLDAYELTTGGVFEWRGDWSDEARAHVTSALDAGLAERGLSLRVVDEARSPLPDQVVPLVELVSATLDDVQEKTPQDAEPRPVDLSVGDLGTWLDSMHADAALVVTGFDEDSSPEREAQVACLGLTGGPAPGEAIATPVTVLSLSLVDRTGDVLWHAHRVEGGGGRLVDDWSYPSFVGDMLTGLSGDGR